MDTTNLCNLPKDLQHNILKYVEFPKTAIQKVFESYRTTRSCKVDEYHRNGNGVYPVCKVFRGISKYKANSWNLHYDVDNQPWAYYKTRIKVFPQTHTRYPGCHVNSSKRIYEICQN